VYYIPFGVFPGWNTELFFKNSSRLGFPTWLKWRIVNSAIAFFPNIAFAYSVIYFVLPRYYFHKKKWMNTTLVLVGILGLIFFVNYFSAVLMEWNNNRLNPARPIRDNAGKIKLIIQSLLFNCPIMAAFAVIVKMMKRSWLKQKETEHIAREKAKAELQLLKAQIHPHFLFNTLNNIYFFTLTASEKAPEMLIKLTDMLRYILNECSESLVPLEKEIKMIEDYMALEKIRYGDRLKMELEIKGDHNNKMISPLLLIPLVENSFKHGTSKMLEYPWINLNITIDGLYLFFLLSNSRPNEITPSTYNGHIGLNNVKKRLQLLYPGAYELSLVDCTESYQVFMKIKLKEAIDVVAENDLKTESLKYEMA
jgi:sensor histidine kinase YesM